VVGFCCSVMKLDTLVARRRFVSSAKNAVHFDCAARAT
jgi:hypothetical protein